MYTKTSIKLCLILRHKPETIGIKLDREGFVNIDTLITNFNKHNKNKIDRSILEEIVRTDDKSRYSFNEDKTMIRCNQGHNKRVNVDVSFSKPKKYPNTLYHGTSKENLELIKKSGIKSMNRQYIHLSDNIKTASKVGTRHGDLVILEIDVESMLKDNIDIFISNNGVFLVKGVIEPKYFKVMKTRSIMVYTKNGKDISTITIVKPIFSDNAYLFTTYIDQKTNTKKDRRLTIPYDTLLKAECSSSGEFKDVPDLFLNDMKDHGDRTPIFELKDGEFKFKYYLSNIHLALRNVNTIDQYNILDDLYIFTIVKLETEEAIKAISGGKLEK